MVKLACINFENYERNQEKKQFDCNKIILPQSFLYQILFDINENVCFPLFFKVTNDKTGTFTFCSASEFDAEENSCYLSTWIQSKLGIEDNDIIDIDFIDNTNINAEFDSNYIPKGTKVVLQPHNEDLYDVPIDEIKPELEKVFVEYIIINKGDIVMLEYDGKKIYLDVCECFPSDHISILDTDLEIDFKEAKEKKPIIPVIQKNTFMANPSLASSSSGSSFPSLLQQQKISEKEEEPKKFIPFSGKGNVLGNK